MPIIRYDHTIAIGNLFYVVADTAVNEGDVMVVTGNTRTTDPSGTKYEVAPLLGGYSEDNAIGIALTDMETDFPLRDDITIVIHGPVEVLAGGTVTINNMVKGVIGNAGVENASADDWAIGRALTTASSGNKAIIMTDPGYA